jgi:SanA protein
MLNKKMIFRNIKRFFGLLMFLLGVILFSNYAIEKGAKDKVFSDINEVPKNYVGMVLGTSKKMKSGNVNLYFTYRINATVELYKSGKIEYVLVSGDNSTQSYDEPTDFKNELIKKGIPANRIYLDYAGFRTLDSVVRAKEIFGQNKLTIISQEFHNERAVYIAAKHDVKAIGYNAKGVSRRYGLKVQIREYFARTKVFIDLLLGIQPKFLGDKIQIG